jgi:hypothetical protein
MFPKPLGSLANLCVYIYMFLLHDNAPAHRSVLVKDFLAKNKMTISEHPPHSLATADFYLFPRIKSAIKGWVFCDATDIIKNET